MVSLDPHTKSYISHVGTIFKLVCYNLIYCPQLYKNVSIIIQSSLNSFSHEKMQFYNVAMKNSVIIITVYWISMVLILLEVYQENHFRYHTTCTLSVEYIH